VLQSQGRRCPVAERAWAGRFLGLTPVSSHLCPLCTVGAYPTTLSTHGASSTSPGLNPGWGGGGGWH
jgi:hypothetical protein